MRLRSLFIHASLALAVSLLGVSLPWFDLPLASVAFWACALGVAAAVPAGAYLTLGAYRLAADRRSSTTWLVFWLITVATWGAGGLYAMGLVSGGSIGFLVSGLSLQLLLGVWVFFRVLTLRN